MLLYYAPGTCALACWIALEWAGAEYQVQRVVPSSNEYRAINPLGMVPAIDIGTERPMTQTDAILHYIADRYEAARLGADLGLAARFKFNETMAFLTGDFHPAFWPHFSPKRFTTDTSDAAVEAVRNAAQPRVERVLEHLNALIGDTGFVYGDRRSVADAYAFVMARWSDKLPKSWRDYPHLSKFMRAVAADPAVTRVIAQSSR